MNQIRSMMSLTGTGSFIYDNFSLHSVLCFYNHCYLTNQIILMMSLAKFGLILGPLIRSLVAPFLYVLKSLLLVFWGLEFLHQ